MQFLVVLGLIVSILAVALIGMAVRLFLVKDGEVRGGCAGKNPMMQEEGVACTMCGALPTEECKSDELEELPQIG
ncbi:MAG: membrane or secreted protein [Bacteroidia bacterium]